MQRSGLSLWAILVLLTLAGCSITPGQIQRIQCSGKPTIYRTSPGYGPGTLGLAQGAESARFADDETIDLYGWMAAPARAPGVLRHIHLKWRQSQWRDISSPISGAMSNPCSDTRCEWSVFSQSPDARWQLGNAAGERWGLWLVSREHALQITDFPTYGIRWWWSDDSAMLWLVWNAMEYGVDAAVATLDGQPQVHPQNADSPLNPMTNRVAFAPDAKRFASIAQGAQALQHIVFRDGAPIVVSTTPVSAGLVDLGYDIAHRKFTLLYVDQGGITIAAHDRSFELRAGPAAVEAVFARMDLSLLRNFASPTRNMAALSPGLSAFVMNVGSLYVFDCVQNEKRE